MSTRQQISGAFHSRSNELADFLDFRVQCNNAVAMKPLFLLAICFLQEPEADRVPLCRY